MTKNPIFLQKLYQCEWISQFYQNGKLTLKCKHCGTFDGFQVNGNSLNVLMELYGEFMKEHQECQSEAAAKRMKESVENESKV